MYVLCPERYFQIDIHALVPLLSTPTAVPHFYHGYQVCINSANERFKSLHICENINCSLSSLFQEIIIGLEFPLA